MLSVLSRSVGESTDEVIVVNLVFSVRAHPDELWEREGEPVRDRWAAFSSAAQRSLVPVPAFVNQLRLFIYPWLILK